MGKSLKNSRILIIIAAAYFLLMAAFASLSPIYLRLVSPEAGTVEISGGYMDGKWYYLIVPEEAITEINGEYFVYTPVFKKTFWVSGTYCKSCKVSIAAKNISEGSESTVAITSDEITDRNLVIVRWSKPLIDGCRIFIQE